MPHDLIYYNGLLPHLYKSPIQDGNSGPTEKRQKRKRIINITKVGGYKTSFEGGGGGALAPTFSPLFIVHYTTLKLYKASVTEG